MHFSKFSSILLLDDNRSLVFLRRQAVSLVVLAALLVVSSANSNAALITLTNPSFENPVTATFTGAPPTGWGGVVGVVNDSAATPSTPDGANVAFMNSGGSLTQTLTTALNIGDEVQITLMGRILGNVATPLLNVDIRDSTGATSIVGGFQSESLNVNTYDLLTYSFIVDTADAAPVLRFDQATGTQVRVDLVTAATLVPEPSSFAFCGVLGITGICLQRRRNRKVR